MSGRQALQMFKYQPVRVLLAAVTVSLLAACSGAPKLKPADLPPPAQRAKAQLLWSTQVGASSFALQPLAYQGRVYLTGGTGTVAVVDATSGKELWRLDLKEPLSTGAGSDGETTAVVTAQNQLVAMADGREIWRVRLPAATYTAPLVAGRRVFVQSADRSVSAFDGKSGARLWSQSRSGEALVLRQAGVLLAVGDTLVTGFSGRLVGLNPYDGSARWEVAIANSRGTNEVERLVDLVAPISRLGENLCVRSYAQALACVDAATGRLLWTKSAQGAVGVSGNEQVLLGSEADGRVIAWARVNGDKRWELERLKYRELSAPLVLGNLLALGDEAGNVHLLATEDGSELTRLNTDGSPVRAAPVLSGPALVVQTLRGSVFAWRSQP